MATASEQTKRDGQIVRARQRGLSWASIAEKHKVSERRAQEIVKAWRDENPTLRHHNPVEIVDDVLFYLEGMAEHLAEQANDKHASIPERVNAMAQRRQVIGEMVGLLQSCGALPRDLGQLRIHMEHHLLAQRFYQVLNYFNVADEVRDALEKALEGELPPGLPAAG